MLPANFDAANPFADLESDLDAGAPSVRSDVVAGDYLVDSSERAFRTMESTNKQRIEVKCEKCRGSGKFVGYTGRVFGDCFACHGKGTILRAANYEVNKQKREERKERKAQEAAAAAQARVDAWVAEHAAEARWISKHSASFEFAHSMEQALQKWGTLTPGQLAAVQKCVAREQEREQAQAAASVAAAADTTALDISSLKGYYAVPDGDTRLKLRVKHPGKDSKYHGWIFVDDGAGYGSGRKYGRQAPGGKYTGLVQEQLRKILADPKAAQVAYGKLTGVCGVCGRLLEDEQSVAAGIGPICAGKLG